MDNAGAELAHRLAPMLQNAVECSDSRVEFWLGFLSTVNGFVIADLGELEALRLSVMLQRVNAEEAAARRIT